MKFARQYSDDESKGFWNLVNGLKNRENHAALYALGCALQNLEHDVLRRLENAITEDETHGD